jgi:hypothetical protein
MLDPGQLEHEPLVAADDVQLDERRLQERRRGEINLALHSHDTPAVAGFAMTDPQAAGRQR